MPSKTKSQYTLSEAEEAVKAGIEAVLREYGTDLDRFLSDMTRESAEQQEKLPSAPDRECGEERGV